jgi:hypothetical protein
MMLLIPIFNQQVCNQALEAETKYVFYTISVIPVLSLGSETRIHTILITDS